MISGFDVAGSLLFIAGVFPEELSAFAVVVGSVAVTLSLILIDVFSSEEIREDLFALEFGVVMVAAFVVAVPPRPELHHCVIAAIILMVPGTLAFFLWAISFVRGK